MRKPVKKRKPLRKKRKKTSLLDIAKEVCEDAWKKACLRRDKNTCQVHGASCQGNLQVDHFRSRRHGHTFFMHQNGTTVCAGLNRDKAMGWNNAAERIGFVVLKREGQATVDYLLELSRQPKKWSIIELENQTHNLNGLFLEKSK